MFRKFIFWLLFVPVGFIMIGNLLQTDGFTAQVETVAHAETFSETAKPQPVEEKTEDFSHWFILDETSVWTPEEIETVTRALRTSLAALEQAGFDGEALLDGYHFRRYAGEYAEGKRGKIALTNFTNFEITLSDSIFLPENEFYIYHELGHVVDARSGGVLNEQFHALTLQIEGVTALHDWTTAQGFFLRGQAHVHKEEATADAFAVWVFIGFAGNPVPQFKNMPENGNPQAIMDVFEQALGLAFP